MTSVIYSIRHISYYFWERFRFSTHSNDGRYQMFVMSQKRGNMFKIVLFWKWGASAARLRGPLGRRRPPPYVRAAAVLLIHVNCSFFFLSWFQVSWDSRRSSMGFCFQTPAHECSGLPPRSSDMETCRIEYYWRLQARCTIPFLFLCLCCEFEVFKIFWLL